MIALILALAAGVVWWLLSREKPGSDPAQLVSATGSESVTLADFADQDTRTWQVVPRGTQVCDGVTFVCDGAIRTAGMGSGRKYPGAVLDVPVRSSGSRIHLLQASENSGGAITGAPYGRIILHYTNRETRRLDLLFAVHGRDWMTNPRSETKPVFDANTTLGWSELHPRKGMLIRFYHTTFVNPLPDVEITSADFVSPLHSANLMLFGLAVNNVSPPLAEPWQPGEALATIPPTDKVTVFLQDAAGRTLPDGTLAWTAVAARGQVYFPPMRADAQGRCLLEFQHGTVIQIRYTAAAAGKTVLGEIQPDATGNFASSVAIKME